MAKLTTTDFAQEVGLTRSRINQMLLHGEIVGEKLGRDWMIEDVYIDIVKNRPERRGRTPKSAGKNGRKTRVG